MLTPPAQEEPLTLGRRSIARHEDASLLRPHMIRVILQGMGGLGDDSDEDDDDMVRLSCFSDELDRRL